MAQSMTHVARATAGFAATGSDEELGNWLQQHAATLLARNDTLLLRHVDRLLALPYQGRPWLELVVAATLFAGDSRDQRAWRLLRDAADRFRRDADAAGLGCARYVEGNWHVTVGDIPAATRNWQEGRAHLGPHTPAYAHSMANQAWSAYVTGDLAGTRTLGEEAVALAVKFGDNRSLGTAYTHLAAYEIWRGAFGRAAANLGHADQAFQRIDDPAERYEWPLALAMTGALHLLRGQRVLGEPVLEQALAVAERTDSHRVRGVVHAIRADICSPVAPQRSIDDAHTALRSLAEVGEHSWSAWAKVAIGRALGASGHRHAAACTIEEVIAETEVPPLERARHLMLLAEQLIGTDPARAAGLIGEAIDRFERCGATYWTGHARARLALVDRPRSARHWERARSVAPHEPAVGHMIRELAVLRVRFFTTPTVEVDGRELRFPTRHALHAVLILAGHAPGGVRADALSAWLWPEIDAETAARRLKTTLWQVRSQFGAAGGRLYRRNDRVVLDVLDAECDLRELTGRARCLLQVSDPDPGELAAVRDGLRQPLVVADGEEWAVELVERCAGLAARLPGAAPTGMSGGPGTRQAGTTGSRTSVTVHSGSSANSRRTARSPGTGTGVEWRVVPVRAAAGADP